MGLIERLRVMPHRTMRSLFISLSHRQSLARLAVSSVLQITTQHSGTPFEATLPRVPWLKEQSYVNAQSIQPVKWVEFVRRIGKFEPPVMLEINRALAAWLNLK